jgi:hypothetical protein
MAAQDFDLFFPGLAEQPNDGAGAYPKVHHHKMTRIDARHIFTTFTQMNIREAMRLGMALGSKRSAIYPAV